MKFFQDDMILHIIYEMKDNITPLIEIANSYEGNINGRTGFNFPIHIINNIKNNLMVNKILSYKDIKYIVVYKKGDILTKKHELQHAKYYLDENFRKEVTNLWDNFDDRFKKRALEMLKKMNYPEHVLMDEFQAYYFTEKPNFFA